AAPASAKALVNDLDLEVITPSSILHLPQILDTSAAGLNLPSVMGADHLNNIEQVVIDNPVNGSYTIRVRGTFIAENPDQSYYVVYDFVPVQLKLTAPAGGEAWAPTNSSGGMSRIAWDADGFTSGTVSLEYSTNGGATWQGIASGLDINRKVFSWWVPEVSTGEALIRLTKDATGESSTTNPFTIIGVPIVSLNAVQCPTYIGLNWRPIPGATDYEVMRLRGSEMESVAFTTDTSYVISGLSRDSLYWVGVRARAGGKPGGRSLALSRQPSNGSCSGTVSNNDLELAAIISPLTGRQFTSSALTASSAITVEIKNLDDAPVTGFDLRYSLNGWAWITENLPLQTIAGGSSYTHTFASTINLVAAGTYGLAVEVINNAPDPVVQNNVRYTTIRHLDNDALVLGFFDDLETANPASYEYDTVGLAGVELYDFTNSTPTGRIKTSSGSGQAHSGDRAFTSETTMPLTSGPYSTNYVTGTFNLSSYTTVTSDVRLDFRYLFSNISAGVANKVWVRGDDTKPWIEAFSYESTAEDYRLSPSIELGDLLAAAGQDLSTSFQVRWGHEALSPSIYRAVNFSIDDVRLYEVFNDVQMIGIDTPLTLNCGLGESVPVKVTVHNSHDGVRTNIPVKYSINGGPWIREVVSSIAGNTTIQYTFSNGPDLSGIGLYTITAIVDDSSDSFHANDTATVTIHNAPLITSFPYLQNFEQGDGGFHADGVNTSWEYGTPSSTKISGAASGSKAWKTRLSGNYNDAETSFLYTPCFNLSGLANPTLSFSTAMDLEDCGATLCDGARVEYSTDGTTWTRLDTIAGKRNINWYNKSNGFWSAENRTRWHVVTCALPNFNQVRFRIVMRSDPGVNLEGIGVDDFHVYDNPNGIYDAGISSSPVTKVVAGTNWVNFESGTRLIASIHPQGQNLGSTDVTAFLHPGPVRFTSTQYYHDRNLTIKPAVATPGDSVTLRLYFLDTEMNALINASGCSGCSKPAHAYELGVSKYSDANGSIENGTIGDNATGRWTFILPANVVKVPFDKGYYAEFKVREFSEFWFNSGGLNRTTPLPVRVFNFSAAKRTSGEVVLEWKSENEQNIARYEIEMAEGNTALQLNRFTKVGSVAAGAGGAPVQSYSFIHALQSGTDARYYRLRIVEMDGSVRYSEVRSIVFTEAVSWKIFPNPSDGLYNLLFQVGNE
ncbi:MAG TPA: hypothetical protein VM843_05175, partial [Flavisolibacter sp.]|nr:hypothetical protein [Flavisolibacter sp.]